MVSCISNGNIFFCCLLGCNILVFSLDVLISVWIRLCKLDSELLRVVIMGLDELFIWFFNVLLNKMVVFRGCIRLWLIVVKNLFFELIVFWRVMLVWLSLWVCFFIFDFNWFLVVLSWSWFFICCDMFVVKIKCLVILLDLLKWGK